MCSRENTIKEITSVINLDSFTISHVHVYGPKSKLDKAVQAVKEIENLTCVEVNCLMVENSAKSLLDEISRSSSKLKTDSLDGLMSSIEKWYENNKTGKLLFALIHSEALEKFKDLNWLTVFFGLNKNYFDSTIRCVIVTVSHVPWSRIGLLESVSQPIQFGFKNYTQTEITKEICLDLGYHENFVNLILKTAVVHCNDLEMLTFVVRRAAEKLIKAGVDPNDPDYQTNSKAVDILKTLKEDLFYRLEEPLSNFRNTVELPYLTKFVLIAAYCASYNPASTDERFFTKVRDINRRRITNRNVLIEKFHETGPRPFELRRLFFIYLFFIKSFAKRAKDDKLEALPNVDINDQISRLCHLGLVTRTSPASNLDIPKFRCDATLDFANEITRSLGINDENGQSRLRDYLFDFASE